MPLPTPWLPALAVALAVTASACGTIPVAAPAGKAPEGAPGRIVEVKARKYEFDPEEIRVRQGELVTLVLESEDVRHGFGSDDLDVEIDLPPGQPVEITFYAERPGEIPFHCTHFCGWGHLWMGGTIFVE